MGQGNCFAQGRVLPPPVACLDASPMFNHQISQHGSIKAKMRVQDGPAIAVTFRATLLSLPLALPPSLSFATAMDAFNTILSIIAPAANIPHQDDAPIDSETTKNSNGGGCTVAHKPVIDAPVDAESTKSSNGGGCIVA